MNETDRKKEFGKTLSQHDAAIEASDEVGILALEQQCAGQTSHEMKSIINSQQEHQKQGRRQRKQLQSNQQQQDHKDAMNSLNAANEINMHIHQNINGTPISRIDQVTTATMTATSATPSLQLLAGDHEGFNTNEWQASIDKQLPTGQTAKKNRSAGSTLHSPLTSNPQHSNLENQKESETFLFPSPLPLPPTYHVADLSQSHEPTFESMQGDIDPQLASEESSQRVDDMLERAGLLASQMNQVPDVPVNVDSGSSEEEAASDEAALDDMLRKAEQLSQSIKLGNLQTTPSETTEVASEPSQQDMMKYAQRLALGMSKSEASEFSVDVAVDEDDASSASPTSSAVSSIGLMLRQTDEILASMEKLTRKAPSRTNTAAERAGTTKQPSAAKSPVVKKATNTRPPRVPRDQQQQPSSQTDNVAVTPSPTKEKDEAAPAPKTGKEQTRMSSVAQAEELTRLMQQTLNAYGTGDAAATEALKESSGLMKTITSLKLDKTPEKARPGTPTSIQINQYTAYDSDEVSSVGSASAFSGHLRRMTPFPYSGSSRRTSKYPPPPAVVSSSSASLTPSNRRSRLGSGAAPSSPSPVPYPPSPASKMIRQRNRATMSSARSKELKMDEIVKKLEEQRKWEKFSRSHSIPDLMKKTDDRNIRWETVNNATEGDDDYVPLADFRSDAKKTSRQMVGQGRRVGALRNRNRGTSLSFSASSSVRHSFRYKMLRALVVCVTALYLVRWALQYQSSASSEPQLPVPQAIVLNPATMNDDFVGMPLHSSESGVDKWKNDILRQNQRETKEEDPDTSGAEWVAKEADEKEEQIEPAMENAKDMSTGPESFESVSFEPRSFVVLVEEDHDEQGSGDDLFDIPFLHSDSNLDPFGETVIENHEESFVTAVSHQEETNIEHPDDMAPREETSLENAADVVAELTSFFSSSTDEDFAPPANPKVLPYIQKVDVVVPVSATAQKGQSPLQTTLRTNVNKTVKAARAKAKEKQESKRPPNSPSLSEQRISVALPRTSTRSPRTPRAPPAAARDRNKLHRLVKQSSARFKSKVKSLVQETKHLSEETKRFFKERPCMVPFAYLRIPMCRKNPPKIDVAYVVLYD